MKDMPHFVTAKRCVIMAFAYVGMLCACDVKLRNSKNCKSCSCIELSASGQASGTERHEFINYMYIYIYLPGRPPVMNTNCSLHLFMRDSLFSWLT